MSLKYMFSMAPKLSMLGGLRSLSLIAMCQTRTLSNAPNDETVRFYF